jgi:hypothetical protein
MHHALVCTHLTTELGDPLSGLRRLSPTSRSVTSLEPSSYSKQEPIKHEAGQSTAG